MTEEARDFIRDLGLFSLMVGFGWAIIPDIDTFPFLLPLIVFTVSRFMKGIRNEMSRKGF